MSSAELERVREARDAYWALTGAPCTGCGYCMPCPNGVDIPRTFDTFNRGVMYANMDESRGRYTHLMSDQDESILASSCIQCGECDEKCPQGIPVSEWMPYIHEVLAEGREYRREESPA